MNWNDGSEDYNKIWNLQQENKAMYKRLTELEWVLARAEEIVHAEHGRAAAYAFTQAWTELPKEGE